MRSVEWPKVAEQSAYMLFYVRHTMKPLAALPVPTEPPPVPATAGAKRTIGPQLLPELAAKRQRGDVDGNSDSHAAAPAIGPGLPPPGWRPQTDGPSLFARNSAPAGSTALPGPLSAACGAKATDGVVRIGRPAGPPLLRITLKPRAAPAAVKPANGAASGTSAVGGPPPAAAPVEPSQRQQQQQQQQQQQGQQQQGQEQQQQQPSARPLLVVDPASASPVDIRNQLMCSLRGDANLIATMRRAAQAAAAEGRRLPAGASQLSPAEASAIRRGVGAAAGAEALQLVRAAMEAGSPGFAAVRARAEAAARADVASHS